jgi:hypothetical protein
MGLRFWRGCLSLNFVPARFRDFATSPPPPRSFTHISLCAASFAKNTTPPVLLVASRLMFRDAWLRCLPRVSTDIRPPWLQGTDNHGRAQSRLARSCACRSAFRCPLSTGGRREI